MKAILATTMNPNAAAAGQADRFANDLIRVTGLIAAPVVWLYFLARDRLSG